MPWQADDGGPAAGAGTTARWEHFPHGADIGVHGVGPTKAEAFRQAGLALTGVITEPERVRCVDRIEIECAAPDDELLLVEWLNAIVYEMATRRMLFGDFEVRIDDHSLAGTARGETIDRARHEPAVEVKGATCTALEVRLEDSLWHARCVVDV
jgi:tRNA nucleotidyltransferase (CCA-adding enzyme)